MSNPNPKSHQLVDHRSAQMQHTNWNPTMYHFMNLCNVRNCGYMAGNSMIHWLLNLRVAILTLVIVVGLDGVNHNDNDVQQWLTLSAWWLHSGLKCSTGSSVSITSAGGAFFVGGCFGLDTNLRFGIVGVFFFVFFVSCVVLVRVID